jgi:hypothetical protein
MLEFEVRLAAAALGLDPGLGILRVGAQARDSLACDLMESCSATSRRILVGLDYPPALEARMVLRREERELPTHGPIREAPLGDDSHLGPRCRARCRMGSASLLEFLKHPENKKESVPTGHRSEGRGIKFAVQLVP